MMVFIKFYSQVNWYREIYLKVKSFEITHVIIQFVLSMSTNLFYFIRSLSYSLA